MSAIATLVRRLADAGATAEAIAIAVEAVEALTQRASLKSKAAIRQANYRARKSDAGGDVAERDATERNETVTCDVTQRNKTVTRDVTRYVTRDAKGSPLPPPKRYNQPPPIPTPKSQGAGARGSRLPDGWFPPEADWRTASEALGPDADGELEKFRDHWRAAPGQRGVKLDWNATWRNWVRRASELARPRAGPTSGGNPFAKIAAELGAFDLDRTHPSPATHDLRAADARSRHDYAALPQPAGMGSGDQGLFDPIQLRPERGGSLPIDGPAQRGC